jgi:hypothetical protein
MTKCEHCGEEIKQVWIHITGPYKNKEWCGATNFNLAEPEKGGGKG